MARVPFSISPLVILKLIPDLRCKARMSNLSFYQRLLILFLLSLATTYAALVPNGKSDLSKMDCVLDVTRQGFRIETSGYPNYWIVSSVDPTKRYPLPALPHVEDSTCPGPDFDVSPNGDWIIADEKLYHGANEVWLLHRESPLHYALAFPSFSRTAWSYYAKTFGKPFRLDCRYITRIGPWPNKGIVIRLTLWGDHPQEKPVDVALDFNLNTRTFSISKDQTTKYY